MEPPSFNEGGYGWELQFLTWCTHRVMGLAPAAEAEAWTRSFLLRRNAGDTWRRRPCTSTTAALDRDLVLIQLPP